MSLYEELFDDEENMRMNCRISERMGHEKGREEGIATGKRMQMEETARRLLSKGMSEGEVSEVTGMPLEDVRRMRAVSNR